MLSAGSFRSASPLLPLGDESSAGGMVIRVLVTLHLFLVMAPETLTTMPWSRPSAARDQAFLERGDFGIGAIANELRLRN